MAFVLALPLAAGSANAAVILDFEDVGPAAQFGSLSTRGFTVSHGGADAHMATTNIERFGDGPDNGSRYLSTMGGSFTLTLDSPGTFDLTSVDIAEGFFLFFPGLYWANTVQLTGTRADNSVVTQLLSLDGVNDGAAGNADFQTFSGAAVNGLSQLVSLSLVGSGSAVGFNGFSLDNFQLAITEPQFAVNPVPAPILLMVTVLGVFGAIARRKRRRRA